MSVVVRISALEYVKGKGYNDIVVYSDFYTDLNTLGEITDSMSENVHAVVVGGNTTSDLEEYLGKCKSHIIL